MLSMDSNIWSEIQHHPLNPNPNPSTDPYAQFYNAHHQSSNPHYPYYPSLQPPNPNYTPQIPSTQFDSNLRPPDIDSYAAINSYNPPPVVGYEPQSTVAYGHHSTQVGSLLEANYYQDPSIVQNLSAKEAIRQYGADPATYAPAGIRPPNMTEPLVPAYPNPTFWTNPVVQPPFNNAIRRGPKKTKVVQSAWCEICKIDCTSKDVLDQHKLGKKHKKNLEKLEESNKNISTFTNQRANNPIIGPPENPCGDVQQRKKRASLAPVVEEDVETKRRKLLEGGALAEAVKVCTICNVVVNSQTVFDFHLSGQKHAAMVKKQVENGGMVAAVSGSQVYTAA